jgi:hypothetical protein
MHGRNIVAPPGKQAVNGENKRQYVVSGENGLLDSIMVFDEIYAKRPVIRRWTWHAKPAVRKPLRL